MERKIGPAQDLPFSDAFQTTEEFVDSLLEFVWTNDLFRTLCGGVHILDFFTNSPDLYATIIPLDWRDFFASHDIMDILDILIREDLTAIREDEHGVWSNGMLPPESLVEYIRTVRKHLLDRIPSGSQCYRNRAMKPAQKLARHVAVGMNVKKVHEVGLFASYIDRLSTAVADASGEKISHLVDFGSGQNYLGRALASEPYNRNIVAIESKQANADRAREYDVMAKLSVKEKLMRNKKAFRLNQEGDVAPVPFDSAPLAASPSEPHVDDGTEKLASEMEVLKTSNGKIQYVEHRIEDGVLRDVVERIPTVREKALMIISLHSCGNLVHHGLRSLILNPEVKMVAMVGCCYNLMTERLGPTTYKLPELRPRDNPRLLKASEARDPHGFPMSARFMTYGEEHTDLERGITFNITSRMMAVQAPSNWGEQDSNTFFTRHFYRALLQRVFLDRGVVGPPTIECVGESSPAEQGRRGTPIIIGSLRKACYLNFVTYVRGALSKIMLDPERGQFFRDKLTGITDAEIARYEEEYKERKKELSVIWSLMAFSASVIEAAIVVDRWSYLKEQDDVVEAWVEPVFDYRLSPRNLVVVGIKR